MLFRSILYYAIAITAKTTSSPRQEEKFIFSPKVGWGPPKAVKCDSTVTASVGKPERKNTTFASLAGQTISKAVIVL